jgi:hypothetical protein
VKPNQAKKMFKCGVCKREFKTRRTFYVCSYCTAITCTKCVGQGCTPEESGRVKHFVPLIGVISNLKSLGYEMKAWEK